jgi:predicted transcriptional regulator
MPPKTDDKIILSILTLHKQGRRDTEIGKNLGIGKSTVQHYLKGERVVRFRKKSDRSKISAETKVKILLLHAEGLNDQDIANKLDIGKSTVSGFLVGKRIVNRKPKQQKNGAGLIICSICDKPKISGEFRAPKSNGKTMSKPSFCKECQREKTAKKLADPAAYLRKRANDLAARARKLGIPFDLTFEMVWEIYKKQDGKCFYTDERMAFFGEKGLRRSLSFDRVVPETGYVIGNVVLCTYKANAVKQDLTLDELKAWLPGWHQRLVNSGLITY